MLQGLCVKAPWCSYHFISACVICAICVISHTGRVRITVRTLWLCAALLMCCFFLVCYLFHIAAAVINVGKRQISPEGTIKCMVSYLSRLLNNTPTADAATILLHSGDGVGQVTSVAWFPQDMTLRTEAKRFKFLHLHTGSWSSARLTIRSWCLIAQFGQVASPAWSPGCSKPHHFKNYRGQSTSVRQIFFFLVSFPRSLHQHNAACL